VAVLEGYASGADLNRAHRAVWESKKTLQVLYRDYHHRLLGACPENGPILDIGGGTAHSKSVRRDIVTADILPFDGIDVVCDAHHLPFQDNAFSGIVMLDVLHHLNEPVVFLKEAARVLRPGGRLAMIEPGMSWLSYPFYRHLHQEPADMAVNPFDPIVATGKKDAFDSNQALPTLLFDRAENRAQVRKIVPELSLVSLSWFSLFAFPLSGGFKPWCLLPAGLTAPLVRLEDSLPAAVRRRLGFRVFIVLEQNSKA
jgi:SAM-dependent methyltransferase